MSYTASKSEPVFWSLFGAGGVVAAFFAPVLILLLGIAVPLGWVPADAVAYDRMFEVVKHPLVKLFIFVVIALPFFHWAHRFRFVVYDLGLRVARGPVAVICYGLAVAGTLAAAWILLLIA